MIIWSQVFKSNKERTCGPKQSTPNTKKKSCQGKKANTIVKIPNNISAQKEPYGSFHAKILNMARTNTRYTPMAFIKGSRKDAVKAANGLVNLAVGSGISFEAYPELVSETN